MQQAAHEFRISVKGLGIGMFVSRLDRSWVGTGFHFAGSMISTPDELQRLQRLCTVVYVDPKRGRAPDLRHVVYEESAVVRRARELEEFNALRRVTWKSTTEFKEELAPAANAHAQLAEGIGEVMRDVNTGGKLDVRKLGHGVDTMIESITRNPAAFPWLMELRRSGEYTYQHALGCAVWAATFGRHLGLERDDLRDLALGGLLCDVGKVRIAPELLTKSTPLIDGDLQTLRSHVQEGRSIVHATAGISENVVNMVALHHERHDGSGYPHGMRANEIPIFARMIGIIDSYDAMTSIRPYAASRSPHEAVMELYGARDQLFQGELVEQFIATSGIYPTGSLVELTNGAVGVVMSVVNPKRLRPCVMLLLDENKSPLPEFKAIDLSDIRQEPGSPQLTIRAGLPRGAFGIDPTSLFLD